MKMKSILFFIFCICAGIAIQHLKYTVLEREQQLTRIEEKVSKEKDTIHVLNAEFAYLTSPQRLKTLADKTLDLQPVKTTHIVSFAKIPDKKSASDTGAKDQEQGFINSSYVGAPSND